MKNNDWLRDFLRERFRKSRHILHPLRTLVLFNLAFLLVYGFVIGEKPYLYAADVSPDGTKIAFSSMEEGKLWCYSSDGTLRFAHTFTGEETAGGAVEVSCADDSVTVYTYRTEQLITFDLSGEKVSQEDAPKERGSRARTLQGSCRSTWRRRRCGRGSRAQYGHRRSERRVPRASWHRPHASCGCSG